MKIRISQLSVTGFRGATTPLTLEFDPSKPMLVIFGENGSGKSTIVDAIDFVANASLGPLEGRQSTPARDYLPALGGGPSLVSVSLTTGNKSWRACLAGSKPAVTGPRDGRPVAHVLRRGRILKLLTAKPAERYSELSRFVDVSKVEAAEEGLRKAVGAKGDEFNSASAERVLAEAQLEQYWANEGREGTSALEWARTLAAQDRAAIDSTEQQADELLGVLGKADVEEPRLRDAEEELARAQRAVATASQQLAAAEAQQRTVDALLMDLLEKAETYVAAHPGAELCPVCEQPIEPRALLARLGDRRRAGEAVDAARKSLERAQLEVTKRSNALDSQQEHYVTASAAVLGAAAKTTLAPIASSGLEWERYGVLSRPYTRDESEQAVDLSRRLHAFLGRSKAALQTIREQAQKDSGRLNAIRSFLDGIAEHGTKAADAERLVKQLKAAQVIVERDRKAFVEENLAGIAGRVCDLYAKVHPGEELGEIALSLDPKRRGSLNLSGRFKSARGVVPEGFYSESHMDTLGICVFLAIAEESRAADSPNLLVLDDVLTSVDGPHLGRFMAMLHDEAEKFDQIIVTTHFRHWFESYKRGHGPAKNAQLLELSLWSIPTGIRAEGSPLPTAELKRLLESTRLDRQAVASKAGVMLEALLSHLALCYRLKLPASPRPHTLGDLRSAVTKKVKAALVTEQDDGNGSATSTPLEPVLEAVGELAFIRNWVGGHFNPLGDEVPNGEVVELGERTLELAAALTCDSCGEMPGKSASSHWRCRCGKRRLLPLALPGEAPPAEDVIP